MVSIWGKRRGVLLAIAVFAVSGLALCVGGGLYGSLQFAGCGAFLLLYAACAAGAYATQGDSEDNGPSRGETVAWSQLCSGAMVMLGIWNLALIVKGSGFAAWALFLVYAFVLLASPLFRRRFHAHLELRRGEVAVDERDLPILAQGDRWARHALEVMLIVMALAWLLLPRNASAFGFAGPLQVAVVLLIPIAMARWIGEARIAWLYWNDRR